MLEKRTLRWLLRVLCDRPFLRVYVEASKLTLAEVSALTLAELEHLFWSLPTDAEHWQESRKKAWDHLKDLAAPEPLNAPLLFQRVFQRIREHLASLDSQKQDDDKQRRLPAFYGLDFLFSNAQPEPQLPNGLVETHAHFRGSVPLDDLWRQLMLDARLRAQHRKDKIEVDAWSRTRAELLQLACELTGDSAPLHAIDCARRRLDEQPGMELSHAVALLAIRAEFGRDHTVQRSRIGLTHFTKAYDRYSNAAKPGKRTHALSKFRDDVDKMRSVLAQFRRSGIHALELRPTFESTRIELQRKLRPLILGYFCHLQECDRPLHLGLVLSLFKQENCPRTNDTPLSAAIVERQSAGWARQVEGLLDVLATVPALRLFVVGIDAAGREQGCPVRTFAPAYDLIHDYHRRHGLADHTPGRRMERWTRQFQEILGRTTDEDEQLRRAAKLWERLQDAPPFQILPVRLGLTMHAGEDFCDPVTGLREIWEAIDHLGLRRGDRLGHALAAGLSKRLLHQLLEYRANSPFPFVEKLPGPHRYRLTKPLGVHLLDEAWASALLDEPASALLHVAGQAFSAPGDAASLRDHLARRPVAAAPVAGLYFYEREKLRPELNTHVIIDDPYYDRFEKLRQRVLNRLRQVGLTIESCPTSNIVVAGLDTPPLATFLEEAAHNVTVASDDPAIFNAWPDHELDRYGGAHRETLIRNARHASFI